MVDVVSRNTPRVMWAPQYPRFGPDVPRQSWRGPATGQAAGRGRDKPDKSEAQDMDLVESLFLTYAESLPGSLSGGRSGKPASRNGDTVSSNRNGWYSSCAVVSLTAVCSCNALELQNANTDLANA